MTAEYFNFLSLIGVAFFAISGALLGHDKDIGGFGVVSDSPESAAREIEFFFPESEVFSR